MMRFDIKLDDTYEDVFSTFGYSVAVCTLLVSIGKLVTYYYFFCILFLVVLIMTSLSVYNYYYCASERPKERVWDIDKGFRLVRRKTWAHGAYKTPKKLQKPLSMLTPLTEKQRLSMLTPLTEKQKNGLLPKHPQKHKPSPRPQTTSYGEDKVTEGKVDNVDIVQKPLLHKSSPKPTRSIERENDDAPYESYLQKYKLGLRSKPWHDRKHKMTKGMDIMQKPLLMFTPSLPEKQRGHSREKKLSQRSSLLKVVREGPE